MPIEYPLKQVLEVKERRVQDQERIVQEKNQIVEKEKKILEQKEAERDKTKNHHQDKLQQMRQEMDQGTTSPKIQQMKAYLKVVKERLAVDEKKVKDQKQQVATAEKNLEIAKNELKIKRQEVDKLITHRKDWTKEMRKELEIIEGREQDEIGSIIFTSRHPHKKST